MGDDGITGADHWPRHAQQWAQVGPPLRPCAEDVASMRAAVGDARRALDPTAPPFGGASRSGFRALVLGVTPELVGLDWPTGAQILAIDRSAAMIAALARGTARCVRADWRALPCAAASLDAVVGDGSASCLSFPHDYARLGAELARVLVPGGVLALRLFASPEPRETLAEVAAAIAARAIGSFHACKWRLAMAIAGGGDVAVADIARALDLVAPDLDALAAHTGWPRAQIATIDAYRGSRLVYSFPARAAALTALGPSFTLAAVRTPGYELGACCPTVVLRRA